MTGADAFRRAVLPRYGQEVTLTRRDGSRAAGRAILQPILEKQGGQAQMVPTALGVACTDTFLYLGEPGLSLEDADYLTCQGRDFVFRRAQPIYGGKTRSHWWGVLVRREEGGA